MAQPSARAAPIRRVQRRRQRRCSPLPCRVPVVRFDYAHGHQFLPLGRGVEKIVGVDRNRRTVIFDTRTATVRAGPEVRHLKWYGSAWAEAGGRLYHLGRGPGYEEQECLDFEALAYDRRREDWLWSLLPSPPFDNYALSPSISSFADAGAGAGEGGASGGSEIVRISTWEGRTYAFDAASGLWRKEGNWTLPFHGRAQYVADYALWFGFSEQGKSDLCAADLAVDAMPAPRHVWADVDGLTNHTSNWPHPGFLSYLGGGSTILFKKRYSTIQLEQGIARGQCQPFALLRIYVEVCSVPQVLNLHWKLESLYLGPST
ncbi:hypothetical protein BAE44_0002675 [Dichanthelium oligosanthes]|uniref:Uncharacterized protein n=1 Tax=Dichanthelium oligosanthes TaxID=888268 RepID=A0A1E5WG44_9POAL|nr:hypothetical protein BAE44_0002675 [Dichanthelium oligosanthes]